MSRGYRLAPEARANVDDICSFIAEDNVDAAIRVLEALEHAFACFTGSYRAPWSPAFWYSL